MISTAATKANIRMVFMGFPLNSDHLNVVQSTHVATHPYFPVDTTIFQLKYPH